MLGAKQPVSRDNRSAVTDETPRVTVVVPVYNRERYVGQAIDSILAQTFPNFELLVIDDGSKDRSRDVVRAYGDHRIRLVCHENNLGIPKTRNEGIRLARGEYLAFLDSDDCASQQRLAKQVAFLDQHPDHAAVGTWVGWMDDEGRRLKRIKRKPIRPSDVAAERLFQQGIENSASMARTDVLRKYGHQERYELGSDFDLWSRIAAHHKIANLPEVLVIRRLHASQTTQVKSDRIKSLRKQIYAEQFSLLGISFSETDLERHFLLRRMHKVNFKPDREYLEWAATWLLRLHAANREMSRYPDPPFSLILGRFWLKACWYASADLGWAALRFFWRPPMRNWAIQNLSGILQSRTDAFRREV